MKDIKAVSVEILKLKSHGNRLIIILIMNIIMTSYLYENSSKHLKSINAFILNIAYFYIFVISFEISG